MSETLSYVPELEKESLENVLIYQGETGKVLLPTHPLVPPDGGVNLTVIPNSETVPYYDPSGSIPETIKPFLLAMATARSVIFEPGSKKYSRYSQWVNLHALPRFGGDKELQFEIVGKNAMNPKAWAMPVKYPKEVANLDEEYPDYSRFGSEARVGSVDYSMFPVVKEEIEQIKQQVPDRLDDVVRESKDAVLFDQEEPENLPANDKVIFSYKNFQIMMAKENPHVEEGGLHLWVHETSGRKNEGVQGDTKNGIEQFIIASAVAKSIYQETGRAIEIHFSSNWGLPTQLQQDEAVARGKDPNQSYITESLTAHANMYAAPEGENRVDLPERPGYARPEILEETREIVKQSLEKHFLGYLRKFEGEKIEKYIS